MDILKGVKLVSGRMLMLPLQSVMQNVTSVEAKVFQNALWSGLAQILCVLVEETNIFKDNKLGIN